MSESPVSGSTTPADGSDWCEYDDEPPCSHCGGEGSCWDGSDPLGDCPDEVHNCHACGGTGRGKDQVIW